METNTTTTSAKLSILTFLSHPVLLHAYITEQTKCHDDGLVHQHTELQMEPLKYA